MAYKCYKCGKKKWFNALGEYIYHCPSCKRFVCKSCLEEPGIGFIRKGFCPNCGCEIHGENAAGTGDVEDKKA
jgi:hypothetical protein